MICEIILGLPRLVQQNHQGCIHLLIERRPKLYFQIPDEYVLDHTFLETDL